MNIHGYRITQNNRLPYYVIQDLRRHYDALESALSKNDLVSISLDYSRVSESGYLTITDKEDSFHSVTLSLRNHDNFAGSLYDYALFLSNFDTWLSLKKFITYSILPVFLIGGSLEDLINTQYRKVS